MLREIEHQMNRLSPMKNIASFGQQNSTSKSGIKRKSMEGTENDSNILNVSRGEDENSQTPPPSHGKYKENIHTSAKKFKDALLNGSSQIATAVAKSAYDVEESAKSAALHAMQLRNKSALPRFNILQNKVVQTEMKRIITQHSSTDDRKGSTRSNDTPLNTSKRISVNAPTAAATAAVATTGDELSATFPGATPSSHTNALLKRLKKCVVHTPSGEVIRRQFDTSFSINEERIAVILSHMKVKSRWDLKEKLKKYEAVVRELRDCLHTTFLEIKNVREQCLIYENHNNNLLRDCYEEFLEMTQSNTTLRTDNFKLHQELSRLKDETKHTQSDVIKYKTEHSPLVMKAKESEHRIAELQAELAIERNQKAQVSAELVRVENDFAELKIKSEQMVSCQKEDFKERLDQAVLGYRDEVAVLRSEVNRRQHDANRLVEEKTGVDKKKLELQEEIVHAQSRMREAEASVERYEKDIQRSNAELERLREQLTLKDADLRATINSLHEIQKQSNDEKSGMRLDLCNVQNRVHLLEEERLIITSQLATKKEEYSSQSREIAALKEQLVVFESKLSMKDEELRLNKEGVLQLEVEKELRIRCEVREENERRERIAAVSQLLATQSECNNRIREIQDKCSIDIQQIQVALETQMKLKENSIEESHKQSEKALGLEMEVQKLHLMLKEASTNVESEKELSRVTGELEVMRRRLKEMLDAQEVQLQHEVSKIAEYEDKLRNGEKQRRKLHNLVQELRGNVRVFARVRPFLPADNLDMSALPDPSITVKSDANSLRIINNGEPQTFSFDKVFGPSCTQESLFNEVSEFVQSALDGYHVCLFSYGQTGSGKTHTMQGSGTGSMRGIIPRAMQQVGVYKTELEAKGWDYQMEVSFVEIYNETIKDLLRVGSHDVQHDIKTDRQGNTFLSDVTLITVDPNNIDQIDSIMEQAAHHRSVGQTAMNERSSRSHSVFALHLRAINAEQGITLKGTLSLVDLAGSERLDRSMATGDMLKETVAINKSLSALADVFVAIANKQSHIPYRNSKLTYLLQPALSGDGKTLMMVNLSPTEESLQESVCSLRLAKQVNQCELGKPKKQVKDAPAHDTPHSHNHSSSSSSSAATPNRKGVASSKVLSSSGPSSVGGGNGGSSSTISTTASSSGTAAAAGRRVATTGGAVVKKAKI